MRLTSLAVTQEAQNFGSPLATQLASVLCTSTLENWCAPPLWSKCMWVSTTCRGLQGSGRNPDPTRKGGSYGRKLSGLIGSQGLFVSILNLIS